MPTLYIPSLCFHVDNTPVYQDVLTPNGTCRSGMIGEVRSTPLTGCPSWTGSRERKPRFRFRLKTISISGQAFHGSFYKHQSIKCMVIFNYKQDTYVQSIHSSVNLNHGLYRSIEMQCNLARPNRLSNLCHFYFSKRWWINRVAA